MSEPPPAAIVAAVERAGGDLDDARDLADVWARLRAVTGPRVDAARREAATVVCRCEERGEVTRDGRCIVCFGRPQEPSR